MMTADSDTRRTRRSRADLAQGRRIVALRQGAGLTRAEVARRAGLTRQALELLEKGYRGGQVGTLRRIAVALKVPLSSIVQ